MLLVQCRRVIITCPKSVVLTLSPVTSVSSFNLTWEPWSRTGEDAIYHWNEVNVSYPWQCSNTFSTQPCLYYYIYFVKKVCFKLYKLKLELDNRKWVQLLRCNIRGSKLWRVTWQASHVCTPSPPRHISHSIYVPGSSRFSLIYSPSI